MKTQFSLPSDTYGIKLSKKDLEKINEDGLLSIPISNLPHKFWENSDIRSKDGWCKLFYIHKTEHYPVRFINIYIEED